MLVITAGCATVPVPEPELQEYTREPVDLADPLPVTQQFSITLALVEGVEYALLDSEALMAYLELQEVSKGNHEIAAANKAAALALDSEAGQLLKAGQAQERRLTRRVDELNQERKDHALTRWYYRLLLTVGLAVAVAAN